MTRTRVRPASRQHRDLREHPPLLAQLIDDLAQLQLHAQVLVDVIAGEEDVRLQVWSNSGRPWIELLWCTRDLPAPSRLAAVRIDVERREVWRSPGAASQCAEVVRFLCDLLLLDDDALGRRYDRLS